MASTITRAETGDLIDTDHARSRWWKAVRRFYRDPKAVIASTILLIFIFVAIFAPLLALHPVNEQDVSRSLAAPSWDHPLGTDRFGRDLLTRMMYGTRISVSVGLIAVGLAAGIGIPIGLIAGYFGGWLDDVLMRMMDAWIAFPNLILIIAIVTIIGPGIVNVMIAIGLNAFPVYARLIRGQTLSIKERDFTQAAVALGANDARLILRHILPNTIQPVIVQASLLVGSAILAEAGLSFLGIGIKPPEPTWGVTIQEGFDWIRKSPWPTVVPGVALIFFVLSTNFMGDRLRDVLDPRMRGAL